uniref:Organic solute transporter alpha-like protein n=1 Tax=Heterorhabditis bacteriophora TaxID=37862 RepID=A0A1I7X5N1_HETBA
MDLLYRSFLILSCVFTVIVVLLAVVHLYYVLKYVSNERIQTDLYYLVFMFPVSFELFLTEYFYFWLYITTFCGVAGMIIPRAAIFLYAVALVYFMFCLFVMVSLLFNIFGSRKELADYLRERGIRISFKVPPVCCIKCLPSIESTDENLRRIEWLVFQTPILRTTLELTNVVVFMELGHRHNMWFMFSQLFGLLSMCVAFYGCYIMVPLGKYAKMSDKVSTAFSMGIHLDLHKISTDK